MRLLYMILFVIAFNVAELVTGDQLVVCRSGVVSFEEVPDASNVVVAEKRRELVSIRVCVDVPIVTCVEVSEVVGRLTL